MISDLIDVVIWWHQVTFMSFYLLSPWLQDDCHNSRYHILIHQCSKTGRKWGGWALFLLVLSLIREKSIFLDTHNTFFYISYIQILIAREADIKIQHLVPLVAKRLCQQGEDQLNKNRDQVRSCWEQVAGLHLTGCAATNTWSSISESSVALILWIVHESNKLCCPKLSCICFEMIFTFLQTLKYLEVGLFLWEICMVCIIFFKCKSKLKRYRDLHIYAETCYVFRF